MDVAIIKYNAGNNFSVQGALRRLGIEASVTDDPELIRKADKVIFPGVGEARTAMEYLTACGLDRVIRSLVQPVLPAVDVPSFGRGRCRLPWHF